MVTVNTKILDVMGKGSAAAVRGRARTMARNHALHASLAVSVALSCSTPRTPSTPAVSQRSSGVTPSQRAQAMADAFNQPGCPGFFEMTSPRFGAELSRSVLSGFCDELADDVGHITAVSPALALEGGEAYRMRGGRNDVVVKVRWDTQGKIDGISTSSDPHVRCEDAAGRGDLASSAIAWHLAQPEVAAPSCATLRSSMDAALGDVDHDGDLDVAIAQEHAPNVVLINDGTGRFTDESAQRIGDAAHDSEHVALADLDGDGDLDLLFVAEDDETNELYLNDGGGRFVAAPVRLAARGGVSNALALGDVDLDGDLDLLIGNAGQNELLLNDGSGRFSLETKGRLPVAERTTQDLELGDVDQDGDLDLVEANEEDNRLLLNDGDGHFVDATAVGFPSSSGREETREADLGDVDGDGDLDLLLANASFREDQDMDPQNRLLINDGRGHFVDETAARLPDDPVASLDGDFVDLDADGDLDIVTGNWGGAAHRLFLNDGNGVFARTQSGPYAATPSRHVVDVEAGDLDGDGTVDLYFCGYRGADYVRVAGR